MKAFFSILFFFSAFFSSAQKDSIPNTGISGVYEVVVGTSDAAYLIRYFNEFGFTVIDSATLTKAQSLAIYNVPSNAISYRLQNGGIDSHGLLRIIQWQEPLGPGVGYTEPETVGQRMSIMLTKDIIRLEDIYKSLRNQQQRWLPTVPVFDDPLRINKSTEIDFFKRPVGVRENAVYGELFNHVFFQRYGYTIPGYGTINEKSNLKTSEFTHHDFMIVVDSMQQLMYLQTALGLRAENTPKIDGDYLRGPKATFLMADGYSHFYQGFVSPNNICGKLKFFMAHHRNKPNAAGHQRLGEPGITMHSFYTPTINFVHMLVTRHGLKPSPIQKNEFGEMSFVFRGPEGATWQIIEKKSSNNKPITKLETIFTKE
ncbi:MAG: hypothetical protein IKD55_08210 [Sediminibacterium sp.]|nr:hypothetical protein [Sediminibacterium sp.]